MNEIRYSIYARESSDDTNKAPPIQEQIKRCKQYAEEQGYTLTQVYEDNGYSGGNWKRPAWNSIKNDAKFHKFNIVLIFSQDRIARDTEQFLHFYRNLKKASVKIYSITEGEINMETVGDRVKHTSLAQASEIFRLITSEKVKKVYELTKRKAELDGKEFKWGREPGNYDINLIINLRKKGLGYREIANQIGGCSYQTIRRLLQKHLPENRAISVVNLDKSRNKTEELPNSPI